MSGAKKIAGNTFVGGVPADFYSKGRVRIPKGSVIVRRSASIPEGKYRISDASKIEEFKQLQGVKIIETSSTNMASEVNNIVRRMGYKVKDGNYITWGGSLSDFNLFNSYLRANGMKPMLHTYTPNGKIEMLIDHLYGRSANAKNWIVKDKAGEVVLDYKKEYLHVLKYIENFAKRTGFPKDFDTKKLAEIIKSSASPQEAIRQIEAKLKFKPMGYVPNQSEIDSLRAFRIVVGGNKYAEITDNLALDYLKCANKKSLNQITMAPVGIDTLPDKLLENQDIKAYFWEICRQNYIKNAVDNTLANRLYELA